MPPENSHKIRRVQDADLAACVDVFVEVFNGPPWNEDWGQDAARLRIADCFRTPGFQGWVAEAGGAVSALALGYRELYNRECHFFLKEMCVRPAWQRRGAGRGLMDQLTRELADAGVHRVYLLTARDGDAEAFYRQCGSYVSPRTVMMGRRLSE